MTEKNNKVTSITKKKKKDIEEQMRLEDAAIKEQMQRDEEEMNQRLQKYAAVMPIIDHSDVTEDEDEEEETFTIDPQNGVITQIVEETILLKEGSGSTSEGFITVQGNLAFPYGDFIRDIMVRKAIAHLIKTIRDERDKIEDQQEKLPSYLAESMVASIREIDGKRLALAKAIRGNEVHYEDIPEWAKPFIEQHIEKIMTNLITMGEEW